MSFDIYGDKLERGHCEVHPHVGEEFPCSVCIAERERNSEQRNDEYLVKQNADLILQITDEQAKRDKLAAKVEQYRLDYVAMETERNELAAQVERFKSVVEAVANIGVDFGYGEYEIHTDTIDFARGILSEPKSAALAALKAQWQAEALECCVESMRVRGYSESNAALVQAAGAIAKAKGEL